MPDLLEAPEKQSAGIAEALARAEAITEAIPELTVPPEERSARIGHLFQDPLAANNMATLRGFAENYEKLEDMPEQERAAMEKTFHEQRSSYAYNLSKDVEHLKPGENLLERVK